jgi:hypothetical protein
MNSTEARTMTRTEAETLAVMLNSAGRRMAQARTPDGGWAWPVPFVGKDDPGADMYAGFYEICADAGLWDVRI